MVARTVVTQHDPGDRVGSSSSGLELKAGGGEGRGQHMRSPKSSGHRVFAIPPESVPIKDASS